MPDFFAITKKSDNDTPQHCHSQISYHVIPVKTGIHNVNYLVTTVYDVAQDGQ